MISKTFSRNIVADENKHVGLTTIGYIRSFRSLLNRVYIEYIMRWYAIYCNNITQQPYLTMIKLFINYDREF